MNILERIKTQRTYFDGGMGSILQEMGLAPGELPELWNINRPDDIVAVHKGYLDAGCNIINANTFGANALKYTGKDGMPTVEEVVEKALENARRAVELSGRDDVYVSLDIGPCGRLLEPLGDYPFEDAVELFAQVVRAGVSKGADLILIETMNDSYESKAALLAAKENSDLPVFVTNVYDETGRVMTGADIPAMVAMLEGLGADVVGMNCSLGPIQMKDFVPQFMECASVPVAVIPNAGLPHTDKDGNTVYDVEAEQFSQVMKEIAGMGAHILGGCCGTTPEYIRATVKETEGLPFAPPTDKGLTVVSSSSGAVRLERRPVLIGERINPTGKKKFQNALKAHDINYILEEGIRQQDAGVDILDVNVGLPGIDEGAMMEEAVFELQSVTDLPLQIDTTDPGVMERALRIYNGKAMINSVNGKEEVMEAILPLVAKYGGVVIGLTIDEEGIPDTAEGRVEIARRICDRAASYGIAKKDILIDPLAMAISADDQSGRVTLEAVKMITDRLGVGTSLGVSNISFGLPRRPLINGTFFTMAMVNGLSAAIMNPFSQQMMTAYRSYLSLAGLDENCMGYIDYVNQLPEDSAPAATSAAPKAAASGDNSAAGDTSPLITAIVKGLKDKASSITREMIDTVDPLDIVNGQVVPALDIVGRDFESGKMFLPQLLIAADAATAAFDVIKEKLTGVGDDAPKHKVVVATVKGDIHDIGKNIVRVLLENYGYDVVDLGKDVAPEAVVDSVIADHIGLCGLSALMTTTVPAMAETIVLLK
ncbi:MAG: homocysteine S-methyltransferase family protein, partial [Eubacterium sp.]|nr:homocysteine S-methyltransferase family protein [Eubacterium sp.]